MVKANYSLVEATSESQVIGIMVAMVEGRAYLGTAVEVSIELQFQNHQAMSRTHPTLIGFT